MPNRFRDRTLRNEYDAAMFQFNTKHPNLFAPDGTAKKTSSTFASYFWKGYEGHPGLGIGFDHDKESRTTLAYAYWRAGQDAALIDKAKKSKTDPIVANGRWNEPEGIKRGKIKWQSPLSTGGLKTHFGFIEGKNVVSIKHNTLSKDFIVSIPGWMWVPNNDAPDGKLGIKESPVIAFKDIRTAKLAVNEAFKLLP
ncbi:MAG: hypothetical protein ACTS9Y_00545 [Methylophilus sp.]|uniref:hypothetical protein n=1 Tax=Methylophilus sp. TaxID=29541 RepID=UPI003FA09DA1